ncbi:ABC transporter permease [Roseivirga sp.]|uniref:ABC transporter permease n=1 Tax=Roseivirga sp. TaxID=1964215 RepID=UPI003B8B62FE
MIEKARSIKNYSEFFWTFTWRNIRLQYNNFWLGLFWGVIQPLLMSAIFYVALNKGIGDGFSHYFIYIYSGFICWSVFFGGLSQAYVSFLQNDQLVKNIYFPRVLLPLTFLAAKLVDLAIAFLILIVLVLSSNLEIQAGWFILYSLLGFVQVLLISAGCNLLFSTICVRYRGFQVIFPFMTQALFFTSSVIYDASASIENDWLNMLFRFNPISTTLATFRLGIFPGEAQTGLILFNIAYAFGIALLGYWWFKLEDRNLIDRL